VLQARVHLKADQPCKQWETHCNSIGQAFLMAGSLLAVTMLTSVLPEAMLWRTFCTPSVISATCRGVLTSGLKSLEYNNYEHSWDVAVIAR